LGGPVIIYRTHLVKNVGGYNHCLFIVEDYDFYFKTGLIGKFGNLPDVLCKYRINRYSVSQTKARKQEILTLYVRIKAMIEYGYNMSLIDKLYFAGQLLSMFLIPQRIKIKIFNLIRNSDKNLKNVLKWIFY
jgi:hypothetical protein